MKTPALTLFLSRTLGAIESLDNSSEIKQQYAKSQSTRMHFDSPVYLEIHPAYCHHNTLPLPHPALGIEFGPVFHKQWFSP